MTDPVAKIARGVATRLTGELDANLRSDVESALRTRQRAEPPDTYFDPVALGALIVSVAQLAWSIYIQQKQQTPAPSAASVTQTVRIELSLPERLPQKVRDRIVEEVVRETLATAAEDEAPTASSP
jgi:hypothetical protein